MNLETIILLASATFIYPLILYYLFLTLEGVRYYRGFREKEPQELPSVTVMIPARNEGLTIGQTLNAIVSLDYPKDRFEVLLLNDGSTDETESIGRQFEREYPFVKVINVEDGGRGKSYVLNYGLRFAKGEVIAIYDADNRPEKSSLKKLVSLLDERTPVVVGKVRTLNWKTNILTRFISMEFMYFQLISQGGRSRVFGNALIPGTNFIIKRSLLEELGGWDEEALAEDLELSFRIIERGYRIAYNPLSISWEQEPESWRIWFKQRVRWATGNVYTARKYLKRLHSIRSPFVRVDVMIESTTYYLFSAAVIASDVIFLSGVLSGETLNWLTIAIWGVIYSIYLFGIYSSLLLEEERDISYYLLAPIMYYTYSQAWILVSLKGLDNVRKGAMRWYKTVRSIIVLNLYYPLLGKSVDRDALKWGIRFEPEGEVIKRSSKVEELSRKLAGEYGIPLEDAQKIVLSVLSGSNVVFVSSDDAGAVAIRLGLIPLKNPGGSLNEK